VITDLSSTGDNSVDLFIFGPDFLASVLLEEIGPEFLDANPSLNFFAGNQVSLQNLQKISLSEFFSKLKNLSLRANP
jgi:hypothetical protein